jgi:hypothetical protein
MARAYARCRRSISRRDSTHAAASGTLPRVAISTRDAARLIEGLVQLRHESEGPLVATVSWTARALEGDGRSIPLPHAPWTAAIDGLHEALASAGCDTNATLQLSIGMPQLRVLVHHGRRVLGVLALTSYEGALSVHVGAREGGGYRGSASSERDVPLVDLIAEAIAQVEAPFGMPPSRDEEARARLAAFLDGALATQREETAERVIHWASLASEETRGALRKRFDALAAELTPRHGEPLHRAAARKLRFACWKRRDDGLALWETDHDPGHGLQVHVARVERGTIDAAPW